QDIPETPPTNQPVYIAPPPPTAGEAGPSGSTGAGSTPGTDADKLRTHYKAVGDAQNHIFGEGLPGSKPPNFNLSPNAQGAPGPTGSSGPSATKSAPKGSTGASGAGEGSPRKASPKPVPVDTDGEDLDVPPKPTKAPPKGATGPSGATGAADRVKPPATKPPG